MSLRPILSKVTYPSVSPANRPLRLHPPKATQMEQPYKLFEELDRWENEGGALLPQDGDLRNVMQGCEGLSQSETNGEENEKIKTH